MQLKPGLYIVSTPIGNLNDITIRAIETLKNSDIIFAEDTRISSKLIAKHHINTPLSVYNDKSDQIKRNLIVKKIKEGGIVSLVSDAGTPLISDPGYKLVKEVKELGCFIDVLPGPCAPIAALTLSGLPSDSFVFGGFLPKTSVSRAKTFAKFDKLDSTLIFFDSPRRIVASLEEAKKVLGDRMANVSRELTKLFQESKTHKLSELIKYYQENPPKGEIVLLISGKLENEISLDQIRIEIEKALSLGLTARDVTKDVFQKYHNCYSKAEIYKICNLIKG